LGSRCILAVDAKVVEKWLLDATQYRAELKNLSKEIRQSNKAARDAALVQKEYGKALPTLRLAAFTHTAGLAWRGIARLARGFSDALVEGKRLSDMHRALKIDIDQATLATGGFLAKSSLVQAANTATELGIKLTSKQFADMTKAAVIMSQRLGRDVDQALNKFTLGLSRMSNKLTDDLGVTVNVSKANEDFAAALGVSTRELTEAQKQAAFTQAALKQLEDKTRGVEVGANDAGAAWQRMSVKFKDSIDDIKKTAAQSQELAKILKGVELTASTAANAIRILFGQMKKVSVQGVATLANLLEQAGLVPKGFTRGATFVAAAGAQRRRDDAAEKKAEAAANAAADAARAAIAPKGPQAKKKRRRRGRRDPGDPFLADDPRPIEKQLDEQAKLLVAKTRAAQEGQRIRDQAEASEAAAGIKREARHQRFLGRMDEEKRARENSAIAAKAQERALDDVGRALRDSSTVLGMGFQALTQFAAGLWSAADAAIQGGASFGAAVAQMAKAAVLSIASQATVEALFLTGKALWASIFMPAAAPTLWASAGSMWAAAAVAGTVGLAISAGTAPSGGGAGAAASGRAPAPRSSFGTRSREREKSVTVVEVFFGDSRDRGAQRFARLQATGRVAA
jgi:hypothetical protein